MSKRIARCGLLIALAFVFGYLEALIPFSIGIPGVKLGLANLVVITALYVSDVPTACLISLIRIVLVGFTFGSPSTMLYSLAGGILSLTVMLLCRHIPVFGITGVSVAGGVAHNIGQCLIALTVLTPAAVIGYLPLLLISGAMAGAVIGLIAGLLIPRLKKAVP